MDILIVREGFFAILKVNPVRNSSGALNPAVIILKPNPTAEQRGIISNGVKQKIELNAQNHQFKARR